MRRPLRIAQVSPLFESVPPRCYGGTERIVSNLTEELVGRGHKVTLFASGDSETSAILRAPCRFALRTDPSCKEPLAPHFYSFELVQALAADFDLVHFHTETLHFNSLRSLALPVLSTMHGRLDIPEYRPLFEAFRDTPLVSISQSQRRHLAFANWVGTVYHGLARDRLEFHPEPGDYLAFLGRLSYEKRFDRAVEIARATGMRLKVAAKIDRKNDAPYLEKYEHLLKEPFVDYVGEIGDAQKSEFLGRAKAVLFPIDWPEPFGLVMIEALACGTPVIAFARGSVPEIIQDGISGYLVSSVEEAAQAVGRLGLISRERCRVEFETRFTTERMVDDYEALYERLIASRTRRSPPPKPIGRAVMGAKG